VSWREAVDWCCRFLGVNLEAIEVNYDELEKLQFAADVAQFTQKAEQESRGLSRATVRQHLQVPAPYFVKRGWSAEVLDRYDVGTYPATGRPLSQRVAVPIYDAAHKVAVGFTARSLFERCERCQRWHSREDACPERGDRVAWARTAKWYNHQFTKENYLYNWWFAQRPIRAAQTVILVEGPGDVWRLEEAGIHYAVGLFGTQLSDQQQVLLEMSGAINIVVLTDMDQSGDEARASLNQRLRRSFRMHFPRLERHDIGEMPVAEVKQLVVPVIEQVTRRTL
jgi:DNA primase